MQVNRTASERAPIGGPGLATRIACKACSAQPVTTLPSQGCTTGPGPGPPLPWPPPGGSSPLWPQALSAPPKAVPVPSFKKVRRFIMLSMVWFYETSIRLEARRFD
jgi:hypothetical protein